MRLCPISLIPEGAYLARNVTVPGKGILLKAGNRLQGTDLRTLMKMGIYKLYINDSFTKDTSSDDTISDSTRISAVEEVYSVLTHHNELSQNNGDKLEGIASVSERMVEDVYSNGKLSIPTHDLRGFDDYTFRHSVNVTAISLVLGRALNMNRKELNELAVAGLLHDIGKMSLAPSILNKREPLLREELTQIRRHPGWGYDLLSQRTKTSPRVWVVARQHHEVLDGQGYPDKRSGTQIHPWARIVTVADMWDALRSDRPYKRGWSQDRVLKLLKSRHFKTKLDAKVLKTFLDYIVPYPDGTLVRMTTRELGVVVQQDDFDQERPAIRIIASPRGKFYTEKESRIVYLADDKEINISQTLT
ncbi:HD-GYP domain-containing protein [bacterium]|nr:HD-GYP domain-containing protein [bacterium]